ncbi:MAG: Holliday junction resolvase RuvX [Candidatus Omnitrophota bacterium]|nr:Holliday junction resolvase RuvX [Candidatus Omnitrophota bacterium]
MRRILGLDIGQKRIGLALSDRLGCTAQGLDTLIRANDSRDIDSLREIIKKYDVEEIVAGLPLNMNGSAGPSAEKVMGFIETLRKDLKLPVKTWDERLTSLQARGVLLQANLSRKKRKKVTDKLAAQLILQGYLESRGE